MKLKFIGQTSCGFIHGQSYEVVIRTVGMYIHVYSQDKFCPYSSPQTLAENWIKE